MNYLTTLIYMLYLKFGDKEEEPDFLKAERKRFTEMLNEEQLQAYSKYEIDFYDFIEDCEKSMINFIVDAFLGEF